MDTKLVMDTELVKRTINTASAQSRPFLEKMGIDPEIYERIAFNAILKTPKLGNCDPDSLRYALLVCAQRGLIPDGESAAVVPYGNQAGLMVMVGGMLDLARRAIPNIAIHANTIHEADKYIYKNGLDPVLEHDENPEAEWGEDHVVAAYAIARLPGNPHKEFSFLYKKVIEEQHRSRSKATSRETPWFTNYDKMCQVSALKTLLRRLPTRQGLLKAGLHQNPVR